MTDKVTTEIKLFPYIIGGQLVTDVIIDGEDVGVTTVDLKQLFQEYLEDRWERDGLSPEYRQETLELVAYLRDIAKQLEIETDGMQRGLH